MQGHPTALGEACDDQLAPWVGSIKFLPGPIDKGLDDPLIAVDNFGLREGLIKIDNEALLASKLDIKPRGNLLPQESDKAGGRFGGDDLEIVKQGVIEDMQVLLRGLVEAVQPDYCVLVGRASGAYRHYAGRRCRHFVC